MAPGHREGCKGLPEPQALRRPGLGREKRRAGVFSVIAAVHMETGTFMTFLLQKFGADGGEYKNRTGQSYVRILNPTKLKHKEMHKL